MPLPDPENFPFAPDPDDFEIFKDAASHKVQSDDLSSTGVPYRDEPDPLMAIVRDWGLMMTNIPAVQAYLAAVVEEERQAQIAALQAALDALQNE